MNKSESIAALATDLAIAQGEIENADKNSVNPHFKNKYADLSEILNTIRPVMSKHGLAVVQFPSYESSVASVETVLTHKSGEWMSGVASCRVTKDDAQGYGSALTYLRRYSLSAVCGISQEDDDGQASVKQSPSKPVLVAPSIPSTESAALFSNLLAYAKSGGKDSLNNEWKELSKENRGLITEKQMEQLQFASTAFDETKASQA